MSKTKHHLCIQLKTIDVMVAAFYFQPGTDNDTVIYDLQTAMSGITSARTKVVLAGDLNLHPEDTQFKEISRFLSHQSIGICSDVNIPTFISRKGNAFTDDYVFASCDLISDPSTTVNIGDCTGSDHFPLLLGIRTPICHSEPPVKYSFKRKINKREIVENPFRLDTETLPSNYNTKAIQIDTTLRQVSNTCKTSTHKKKGWWTNDLRELRAHSIRSLKAS